MAARDQAARHPSRSTKRRFFSARRHRQLPLMLWASAGLMLIALILFGHWLLKREIAAPSEPKFDQAYQAVLKIGEAELVSSPLGSSYGIRQLDYDTWRQLNGKAVKDLAEISEAEVKAIYQERWQRGNCAQYDSPLDVTCLDSLISFGAQATQLLANLPADAEQAALEVVSRREALRRTQMRPPFTPSKRLLLREGQERDRALADLIVSGTLAQPLPLPNPLSNSAPFNSSGSDLATEQIYTEIKPSTVEIWNVQNGVASTAAGIILSANGLILTNRHVVESNPHPTVKLADGRKFSGIVTSFDASLDLALIQLDRANNLPVTPLADSTAQVKVGDPVYAIGSPRGESWKMSQSQVIELNSTCANGASPLRCIRMPSGFLQPGNSGGPLINNQGQVIGINRSVQQTTGEGVSIPVETIQNFLAQRMGQPDRAQPSQPNPGQIKQPKRWL